MIRSTCSFGCTTGDSEARQRDLHDSPMIEQSRVLSNRSLVVASMAHAAELAKRWPPDFEETAWLEVPMRTEAAAFGVE